MPKISLPWSKHDTKNEIKAFTDKVSDYSELNDGKKVILVPSRDGRVSGFTLSFLISCFYNLGYSVFYFQGTGNEGYSISRTNLFLLARDALRVDNIRGFLLDDDIVMRNGLDKLIQSVKIAEDKCLNFVAPYKLINGFSSISKTSKGDPKDMYTWEEAQKIPDWTEVKGSGLGFYYGEIPLTYTFHENENGVGEDLNFFNDNNLKIHCVQLGLKHLKAMEI